MAWLKQLTRAPFVQHAAGVTAAQYLRLVWHTSRFVIEPSDIYERIEPELPVIFAFWHGQHFLMPFAKPAHYRAKVLISRHRDGEINAIAAARFGVDAIRGSGDHARRFDRKGGVTAFRSMLTALERQLEHGAYRRHSQSVARRRCWYREARSAVRTTRFIRLRSRPAGGSPLTAGTALPSTCRLAAAPSWPGAPIRVPADVAADELERARLTVETSLNEATERAYAIVDRRSRDDG